MNALTISFGYLGGSIAGMFGHVVIRHSFRLIYQRAPYMRIMVRNPTRRSNSQLRHSTNSTFNVREVEGPFSYSQKKYRFE